MKKVLGYYLFAIVYYICRLFPMKKKSVFCIMSHDEGEGSNVAIIARQLQERDQGYTFFYLKKSDIHAAEALSGISALLSFFFRRPYEMARSEIILLDNIFLPFAYLRRRKNTKVVQLWHGTGTIKKFGQDVNVGKLKELENKANRNITHLIVNSDSMVGLYAGAFGVSHQVVYPIGLPKTDDLLGRINALRDTNWSRDREYIYQKYGIPKEKKLILYAPTFRDVETENVRILELIDELARELPKEYCIGLRLHPFIAAKFGVKQLNPRIYQLSFESDVNSLMLASDILITDYSSIIFEFCLTEKPMLFYAYDYTEFSNQGRGFYRNYDTYVPGPVAYSSKEVVDIIKEASYDMERIHKFKMEHYEYLDGKASERLICLLSEKN